MVNRASISTREFRHLWKITKAAGHALRDEEIYALATRILDLCKALTKKPESALELTEQESKAFEIIKRIPTISARSLSQKLGYKSSRSGHMLIQRLINKQVIESVRIRD